MTKTPAIAAAATASAMPAFACYRHRNFLGMIYAVSYRQAMTRARNAYGRCEVIATGNVSVAKSDNRNAGDHNEGRVDGRAPYAVGDFEARRQAEIAKWKASQA